MTLLEGSLNLYHYAKLYLPSSNISNTANQVLQKGMITLYVE